ncbi:hypothetical protein GUJ93_ZPchr0011g27439 [Zizania palustris]|nr:hypothetical protein GUJ93_ZPchr0011g27439 [Zizania palustris]
MPCCNAMLSAAMAAAAAASHTPRWLQRLHTNNNLSFPSNLQIDDIIHGQRERLPLPPPSSNSMEPPPSPEANQSNIKQRRRQQKPHQGNISSLLNPSGSKLPPPQPQLPIIIADLFATPSSAPPANPPPIKALRKQSHPHRILDKSPRPIKENKHKAKAKVKESSRTEHTTNANERCTRNDVTIIDTSTNGWKAEKLLVHRGSNWKVYDKKASVVSKPMDPTKVKRRSGLVLKMRRDMEKEKEKDMEKEKEKEKESTSLGNIHASSRDVMKELDIPIRCLKR